MEKAYSDSVVVVDDDPAMRNYLRELLGLQGYRALPFADGDAALRYLASTPDPVALVLCDINMPGISGVELLGTVKAVVPDLPFILLSGLYEQSLALNALRLGATDYLMKPALPADISALLRKHIRAPKHLIHAGVRSMLKDFLNTHDVDAGNTRRLLVPLFEMLGIKRFETMQHSQRVAAYSRLIGVRYGLDAPALKQLEVGALLHDIGKAAIPHNVLMKPTRLNSEEWAIMQTHPQIGADLLAGLPGITAEAEIVYSHHERADGNGYPRALKLKDIVPGARIFGVADTFDAMSSNRPYRAAGSIVQARLEIGRVAGAQFDRQAVDAFQQVSDREIEEVQKRFCDVPVPLAAPLRENLRPDFPGLFEALE